MKLKREIYDGLNLGKRKEVAGIGWDNDLGVGNDCM